MWKILPIVVLSVTILETTKTKAYRGGWTFGFYRSQFWRLQKHKKKLGRKGACFIGHNFGDYKNHLPNLLLLELVLSVTILETTKTDNTLVLSAKMFYRSQFWRLQKLLRVMEDAYTSFIGHNFGDYKNTQIALKGRSCVLSVTILETTKTSNGIS